MAPVGAHWLWRVSVTQTIYRMRVVKPRPAGTLALPRRYGIAASIRRPRHRGGHGAPSSRGDTDRAARGHPPCVRAAGPGRAGTPGLRVGSCAGDLLPLRTHRPSPESSNARSRIPGRVLRSGGRSTATRGDESWTSRTYAELINRAGPAGERHATTISLALDMKTAARPIRTAGGGMKSAAAVLRQEMSTLTAALHSADLKATDWLTPGQLAVILRSAYDPAIAATLGAPGTSDRTSPPQVPWPWRRRGRGCARTARTMRCCG